jgi:hypothetical protein
LPIVWRFRYYLANGRQGDVRACHDAGSAKCRAIFRSKLVFLAQLERSDWREPLFKSLHGECAGLGEIRFKGDNVEQRPLGFASGLYEFTLLFWAIEKNNRFVPRSACETALAWKRAIVADRSLSDALWFALE